MLLTLLMALSDVALVQTHINAYCRVADVAEDAELQEKSEADLQHLADLILTNCDQTMKEFEEKQKEEMEASPLADGNNGNAFTSVTSINLIMIKTMIIPVMMMMTIIIHQLSRET